MPAYLALFNRITQDAMRPVRTRCEARTPCESVVRQLADTGEECAVIVDRNGHVQGLLTLQGIARHVACRVGGDMPVARVMTTSPYVTRGEVPLYRALAEMDARHVRHAPVIAADGALLGVLYADEARQLALPRGVARLEHLATPATLEGLKQARARQVDIARALLGDNPDARNVQQVISRLNDDLHSRLLALAMDGMDQDGWGPPPAGFALILMGSAGRMESFLDPDQDNGFVIADYPDSAHGAIDRYFVELARRLTQSLDTVGIPLCKGHVMATNPLWRKTLSQWHEQIRGWLRRRTEQGFLQSNILLDCRGVAGEAGLAAQLRHDLTHQLARSRTYLRALTLNESTRDVGLGWFDRLVTESGDSSHAGEIDLKRHGIMPIVEVARFYALAHGIETASTPGRLQALADAGALSADDADALQHAHGAVAGLILRRQLDDLSRERPPSKHVDPRTLTRRERETLVASLKNVQGMVRRLSRDLVGADMG
ncbi:DUF294 nucleotidyltransferase-like domain-containing protein [Aquisalimonas sp.]|uniref:DUF294 nucleotidyltransferase-like domain-containing protein n=1 Tax=Aquisalimonas sp. TaxID=1872621 RepID=UPI0025C4ABF0|nr:DUF294 nucleotidyltransferase-like domain-containing protein [Aquisalimonas sp.]